jgi:hypothetical protein
VGRPTIRRWHFGVANPILTNIEEASVAKKAREWLIASAAEVRVAWTALALVSEKGFFVEGLMFFDPREFLGVLSALIIPPTIDYDSPELDPVLSRSLSQWQATLSLTKWILGVQPCPEIRDGCTVGTVVNAWTIYSIMFHSLGR